MIADSGPDTTDEHTLRYEYFDFSADVTPDEEFEVSCPWNTGGQNN